MHSIGKFEVLKTLGQGGQSTVYLARDPDLDRPVAIKLIRSQGQPGALCQQWLQEARAIGALRHPAIVAIHACGEHAGSPYLVFEYVEGHTLAQLIQQEGALAPLRAVTLLVSALEALAAAHEAGFVHRDFKPSNILVNSAGRVRVTDFGIATRAGQGDSGQGLSGTPSYMAPEYISSGAISPQNDVFAAGLVLFEMLFARRAFQGEGILQTLHQVAHEPLVLPSLPGLSIPAELLDVLGKATAKDPVLRYASVQHLQEALRNYLSPAAEGPLKPGSGSSTLDFLLLRMRHKTDFPSMSASIATINQLAGSERSDAATLSNAILKDLALTNKVLRIANSAFYTRNGSGHISTVSRAIVILGFETIRQLAISLMLFEHIPDKGHSSLLKDEFLRANLRGLLARALGKGQRQRVDEQAFICGLFHGLGRLLVQFYFQEEAAMLARLVASERCSENTAAARVLGIRLDELGIGIAKTWGFPESLIQTMRGIAPGAAPLPASEAGNLQLLVACADELGQVLETQTAEHRGAALTALLRRYGSALALSPQQLTQATTEAVDGLSDLVRALNISARTGLMSTLLPPVAASPARTAAADLAAQEVAAADGPRAETLLAQGVQEISSALVDEAMKPGDILSTICEVIYRALKVRRVLICLKEGNSRMRARYGMGEGVESLIGTLAFESGGRDFFSLVLAQDVDVLVSDASAEKVKRHLPPWFQQQLDARSFLVQPLHSQGSPIGMIYAEWPETNGSKPSAEISGLLRTLRNQVLLVARQQVVRGSASLPASRSAGHALIRAA